MNYNIIIPITVRNMLTFDTVVHQLKKNIKHSSIIAIGHESLRDVVMSSDVYFINEDQLFPEMTLRRIESMISKRDAFAKKRAGWYFQQFIKLGYAYICQDDYYLTWDADTIPLREIRMLDDTGHPFFDVKEEYNRPYFSTINRLFNGSVKKNRDFSFISEHMLFSVKHVLKMLGEIETNALLEGSLFYEKILNAVSTIDLLESGFSEFETYGNYMMASYPSLYRIRKLSSLRDGDGVYGKFDRINLDLHMIGQEYDLVTFENRNHLVNI